MAGKYKTKTKKREWKPRRPTTFARKKSNEPLSLDGETIRKLAEIHCTDAEICKIIGCDAEYLKKHYKVIIDHARATGASSLRRRQYQRAMEGNDQMLIWLGKNILKQSDRIHATAEYTDNLDRLSDDELEKELEGLREVGEFAETVKLKALEAPESDLIIDVEQLEKGKASSGN